MGGGGAPADEIDGTDLACLIGGWVSDGRREMSGDPPPLRSLQDDAATRGALRGIAVNPGGNGENVAEADGCAESSADLEGVPRPERAGTDLSEAPIDGVGTPM